MDSNRKGNLVLGVLLLLVGGWFLAQQFFPQLRDLIQIDVEWPLFIVGVGAFFLLMSVLLQSPGLAVPAAIIGGLGGIFYYQNMTGDWQSWSYAWTLIPSFVGVGIILSNLLQGRIVNGFREGVPPIVFSLVMFVFFSGILGATDYLSRLWPLLLIGAGISILVRNFRERRSTTHNEVIEQ